MRADTRVPLITPLVVAALLLAACQRNQTPAAPAAQKPAAVVDAARLAAPAPEEWLSPGRDPQGTYF